MHNKLWPHRAAPGTQNYLLGICCALLFLGPFFFPTHLWFLIFFFPAPFLRITTSTHISFLAFYSWSLGILTVHSWGIVWGIFNLSCGPFVIRIAPLAIALSIQALYPAAIFWLTQWGIAHFPNLPILPRLLTWVLSVWLVFWVLMHISLWYTGTCEGYPLINPLLPLATHPALLAYILPALGTNFTLLLMLSFATPLAYALITHSLPVLWLSALLTLPWAISWAVHRPAPHAPAWVQQAGVSRESPKTLLAKVDELSEKEYLFFPESACADCLAALCDLAAQLPTCTIIAGGFRDDHGAHRNTTWLLRGTIQSFCDKRHAMALAERIPALVDCTAIRAAYFHQISQVVPTQTPRPRWQLSPELTVVPYICSELFFFEKPDDPYYDPIIALCYDSWPSARYVQDLLLLTARYKAIAWQRDIIYVGYAFQALCSKNGGFYSLPVWDKPQNLPGENRDSVANSCEKCNN